MDNIRLSIDGRAVEVAAGTTILEAARRAGIYIPVLCHHPDLPPVATGRGARVIYQGGRKIENTRPAEPARACGLCVVQIDGRDELVFACSTSAEKGMVVVTGNERIDARRRENLLPVMIRHRHACLTCAQQAGCSLTQCSSNVSENERCCSKFGHCELQNVANFIGILDSTPRWVPTELPVISDQPLFESDPNLCIGCTRCVRACRDLRGVEAIGFVYDENDRIQVGSLGPSLEQSACRFCTACVQVCPTGALVDKSVAPGTRQHDLVPCTAACPVHMDIAGYLRMIARNRADDALVLIREKAPLPGVLGRVCTHPCEEVCRRGQINESISVCALKRYAADGDDGRWRNYLRVAADSGKKVAVIGAGPAGLTAAFYLRRQGHAVCVFDANPGAGGMMRYGIPSFRLPREVLDKEIDAIFALGIDFRPGRVLGRDFTLAGLKNDGFEAVFLAVGAQQNRRIVLEGGETLEALGALAFLRRVAEGGNVELKGRVVVIGGGNIAVDAARTALRCGAADVKMLCLERPDEMPAGPWEIEQARKEGVQILPCRGPAGMIRRNGRVTGMNVVECTAVFDDQGKFCPQFGDQKDCLPVEQVIVAVGQAVDFSFQDENSPLKVERGRVVVDAQTLETGMPGVYAGGDVTGAAGSIIHAIAAGRRAAQSIDRALGGGGEIDEPLFTRENLEACLGREEGFAAFGRQKMPELDVAGRIRNFREVAAGYGPQQAAREAARCLQCDLRLNMNGNPLPPADWQPFDEGHILKAPEAEGVLQLADGDRHVLAIKGTDNLRRELLQLLEANAVAVFFNFEQDRMYSRRESELLQEYLQAHGQLPADADNLDDLY